MSFLGSFRLDRRALLRRLLDQGKVADRRRD